MPLYYLRSAVRHATLRGCIVVPFETVYSFFCFCAVCVLWCPYLPSLCWWETHKVPAENGHIFPWLTWRSMLWLRWFGSSRRNCGIRTRCENSWAGTSSIGFPDCSFIFTIIIKWKGKDVWNSTFAYDFWKWLLYCV